eukprot:13043094-Heterocapsa_arctica.AAC.1
MTFEPRRIRSLTTLTPLCCVDTDLYMLFTDVSMSTRICRCRHGFVDVVRGLFDVDADLSMSMRIVRCRC